MNSNPTLKKLTNICAELNTVEELSGMLLLLNEAILAARALPNEDRSAFIDQLKKTRQEINEHHLENCDKRMLSRKIEDLKINLKWEIFYYSRIQFLDPKKLNLNERRRHLI